MDKRGPQKTPTAVLKMRGSWRAKIRPDEPQSEPGAPRCPAWMGTDAKHVWRQVVPLLEEMGVLSKINSNTLARYCSIWVRWKKADAFLREHGEVYPVKDDEGQVKSFTEWPQVGIASRLGTELLKIEQNFGMTPSSRAGIQVAKPDGKAKNDKTRFFKTG